MRAEERHRGGPRFRAERMDLGLEDLNKVCSNDVI